SCRPKIFHFADRFRLPMSHCLMMKQTSHVPTNPGKERKPKMKTRNLITAALLVGLLCLCQAPRLIGQNLLLNGDFEAGNTGFTSDYTYSPGDISPEGTYNIVRNPHDSHPGGASFGDHTSGTGLMLAANGASNTNLVVWRQSVAVVPNTTYEFSGWGAS